MPVEVLCGSLIPFDINTYIVSKTYVKIAEKGNFKHFSYLFSQYF